MKIPLSGLSKFFKTTYFRRGILALAVLGALTLSYTRAFELYELQTYDMRAKMRGLRPFSPQIIHIDIWDDTTGALGWPIDRKYYGYLVKVLHKYGVSAVMFDIVFPEPQESDRIFAEASAAAGNVFIANAYEAPQRLNGRAHSNRQLAELVPTLEASAKAVGFINVRGDVDGKRRRVPLVIDFENKQNLHLTVLVALDALGIPRDQVQFVPGRELRLGKAVSIPLDEDGDMIVNFAGKWMDFAAQHYSFREILLSDKLMDEGQEPYVDLHKFKGKICIVGHTATGTVDSNATPLEPIYPNVGIHGNILSSIFNHDFIRRLPRTANLVLFAVFGLIVFLCCSRNKPLRALFYATAAAAVYAFSAVTLFTVWGIWIDLFYPLAAGLILYAAITFTRMILEMKKREVIENELKIASQIQKSFLPENVPQEAGFSLAVYMKPAKAVGGDLYTFVPLAPRTIGVMLGDVSGKGTPAALFMAKAVSEFKFSARDRLDPSEALVGVNDSISSESTGGLFVTLVYLIFDLNRNKMLMSNGGHLPVVLVRRDGSTEQLTADGGMPIGVMGGIPFSNYAMDLKPGDCFALYSDGVSEARNIRKDEFGIEALQKIMVEHRALSAQQILENAVRRLNEFMGKADQHDDITLMIVKLELGS